MSKIAIISDVNAGLDYIGYDPEIPVLRSIINFGDEHYVDGIAIKADEFYARLKANDSVIPSTSAPTVGEAMELLEKLIEEKYTDVIMYSISYQLSSIGQMVETLREEYEDKIKIHVVDTKTATYLQGYIAVSAKEMAKQGKSVQEILDYSYYLIDNMHAYFVVDNLTYLVKNGRLSGAAGFVGNMLKIKPILEMNKQGKIVSKEKVKTHRKAVERALEMFLEEIKDVKKVKIFVFHTIREDDAKTIKKYLEERCPNALPIEIHMVTPAVGAHIGCGVLGFGYFILER
ncbi:MAG TPA: DegV family protein [Bacilli bacterium]|jgi:DegV family protein with EDD domain|nr:DegV family protein [Bacilli bacterium]NLT01913.1 DegV family protein [Acholeplasmataceae bacterium]HAS91407.1 DegV family protein [Clostridiales bacterium]HNZ77334.1 DegV family protein [Bacilli bacterium]HOD60677.1 DegV family protein [Bacilli bacterium]